MPVLRREAMRSAMFCLLHRLKRTFGIYSKPYLDYFQKAGFTVHIVCQLNRSKELFDEKDILVHEIPLTRSAFAVKNIWRAGILLKEILQRTTLR